MDIEKSVEGINKNAPLIEDSPYKGIYHAYERKMLEGYPSNDAIY